MENNNNTHNRFGSLGAASYGRGRGFILIVFTGCGRGRGGGRRRGVGGMGGACNRFIWFIYKRGGHGHITCQLKFPILTFFIKHLATGIIHVSSILRQLWPHKKVPLSYFFFFQETSGIYIFSEFLLHRYILKCIIMQPRITIASSDVNPY